MDLWITGSNVPGYLPDVDTTDDALTWDEALDVYRAGVLTLAEEDAEEAPDPDAWVNAVIRQAEDAIPATPGEFSVTLVRPDGWARAYWIAPADED